MQFQTGAPFNIVSGQDNSRRGLGNTRDRAKLTGVSVEPPEGSDRTVIFNADAFAVNDVGTFGDVPRGYLHGPSLHSWDMALGKNFRFTDDIRVQFRAEFYNVFNQVNLDIPGTSQNDDRTSVSGANYNKSTRTIPGVGDPRIISFGLKFVF